jgi:adenine phosphoribosyltransferase
MLSAMEIGELIRTVPDFPIPGVMFKDITTLLTHPGALEDTVIHLETLTAHLDYRAVAAIESRGFVFGSVLAARKGIPLVLIRKPGKLPAEVISQEYSLEYGTGSIHMHRHSLPEGTRVLIVDDLVATGGSAAAAADLLARDGCEVAGAAFVIDLGFLGGRTRLERKGLRVESLLRFPREDSRF